jgi:hypothetical protein
VDAREGETVAAGAGIPNSALNYSTPFSLVPFSRLSAVSTSNGSITIAARWCERCCCRRHRDGICTFTHPYLYSRTRKESSEPEPDFHVDPHSSPPSISAGTGVVPVYLISGLLDQRARAEARSQVKESEVIRRWNAIRASLRIDHLRFRCRLRQLEEERLQDGDARGCVQSGRGQATATFKDSDTRHDRSKTRDDRQRRRSIRVRDNLGWRVHCREGVKRDHRFPLHLCLPPSRDFGRRSWRSVYQDVLAKPINEKEVFKGGFRAFEERASSHLAFNFSAISICPLQLCCLHACFLADHFTKKKGPALCDVLCVYFLYFDTET